MSSTQMDIKAFKKAVQILQRKVEKGFFKNNKWTYGICHMLYEETLDFSSAHDVMEKLLTESEYTQGLGPDSVLNEDRKVFLEFLEYTLTEEDIFEICNQKVL